MKILNFLGGHGFPMPFASPPENAVDYSEKESKFFFLNSNRKLDSVLKKSAELAKFVTADKRHANFFFRKKNGCCFQSVLYLTIQFTFK